MYNETKIDAYLHQIRTGQLRNKTIRVLDYIRNKKEQGATKEQIMIDLYMVHQSVTAVLSNLQDLGIVYSPITVQGRAATKINLYRYEPFPPLQKSRAKDRRMEKYFAWVKRGKTEFADFLEEDGKKQLLLF